MTYIQTLKFIAKCLTINFEVHNKVLIEAKLKEKNIDWESIVKVSTSHYVLPALYCNLKKASFLNYLPEDLVSFMEHITTLNKNRNAKIVVHAKEINLFLIKNGITPIFLKGTGNLLESLYIDLSERMTRDIDILVSGADFNKTIDLLKSDGYKRIENNSEIIHRHFPALVKENKIAAIEVHKELITKKYSSQFDYNFIEKNIQKIDSFHVLDYKDQYCLTAFAHQINDYGYLYKSFSLRNAYDIFLLSKKTDTKDIVFKFKAKTYEIINCFVAITNDVFNNIESITLVNSKKKNSYLKLFYKMHFNQKSYSFYRSLIKLRIPLEIRLNFIIKSFYNKKYLVYVLRKSLERITSIKKTIK